ncbi:MAG: tetratricopeptide repeat protein [Magnetococcales bacterium]|nr:tetratricopeptide repeat protein [Magnetococcales bacterium]
MQRDSTTPKDAQPQLTVNAAYDLAIEHFNAHRFDEADKLCTAIIQTAPNHIDAINLLGVIAQAINRHDLAVEQFQRAINIDASRGLLYFNLAISLNSSGERKEAITALESALEKEPGNRQIADYLHAVINDNPHEREENALKKGVSFHNAGRFKEAIECYKEALAIQPDNPITLSNMGTALQSIGMVEEGISSCKKAISIAPDYADPYNNLGYALQEKGRHQEAVNSFQKAVSINPGYSKAYFNLGNSLKQQGKHDEAAECFKKAISIDSSYAEAYCNLASILNEQGKIDEAVRNFEKAIAIKPGFTEAYHNLATTKKFTKKSEIQKIKNLLSNETDTAGKINLNFALGKAMADMKNHSESFKYFHEGNRLKRAGIQFDISHTKQLFSQLKETFNSKFFQSRAGFGCKDSSPIFILGMPRSGSTLIEQILSSHADVYGAGELTFISDTLLKITKADQIDLIPKMVAKLSADDAVRLGDEYIKKVRKIEPATKFITDKMPENFMFIGLIKLILPNAKIIHSLRLPEDTCLSIFRTNFTQKHHYAYELGELGEYYRLYSTMMTHWQKLFPEDIYNIHYEDLIDNQEYESKKLLAYCKLDWDDRCLNFHESVRSVKTASSYQVRQPIYRSSVAGWLRFKKQLQPLTTALGDLASETK